MLSNCKTDQSISDGQANYTHFEKTEQKGESNQWKFLLQYQVNLTQWDVILVKNLVRCN